MIDGTEGDDVLAGSMWNDFFDAMGGDDVLDGLDGADEMWAGEGQDTLYGAPETIACSAVRVMTISMAVSAPMGCGASTAVSYTHLTLPTIYTA